MSVAAGAHGIKLLLLLTSGKKSLAWLSSVIYDGQFKFAGNISLYITSCIPTIILCMKGGWAPRYGKQNVPIYSGLQLDSLLKCLCLNHISSLIKKQMGAQRSNFPRHCYTYSSLVGCDEGIYADLCILLAIWNRTSSAKNMLYALVPKFHDSCNNTN